MRALQRRLVSALLVCACVAAGGRQLTACPAQTADVEAPAEASPFEWVGPATAVERAIGVELRAARAADERASDAIAKRLVAMGAPAIPALLSILCQGRVPHAAPGDAPQKLSEPQRALALATLARLPRGKVVSTLNALLAESSTPSLSLTAIDVLGVVGGGNDLLRLPELAPRVPETPDLTRASRDALRRAFAGILRREKRLPDNLQPLLESPNPQVTEQVLGALADLGDPRGLSVCFAVARSRPNVAQTAIALLPRFRPSNDVARALEIAAWLRGEVDFHRVERTRAVFNALAVFDEGASIPVLVDALGTDEVALRDSALIALRRITGLQLPADAARWTAYYRTEAAWFETARPRQAAVLLAGRPSEVTQAVRSYVEHRLFRSQLAADLLPLLSHSSADVRLLGIDALVQVGSRQAVSRLLDAIDDADPRVSAAARTALRSIVGADMPSDAGLLRERLLGDA
jgi:HEAT repeat protein